MSRYWYVYIAPGDPHLAVNYELIDQYPAGGCTTGTDLCMIYAPSGNNTPDAIPLGSRLYNYITLANTAQGGGLPQPQGGGKFFVYLKNLPSG